MEKILKKTIEILGGPVAVAKLFTPKISAQAVCAWKVAPPHRVLILEEATRKAGQEINRHQLRPDIFGSESQTNLYRRRNDLPQQTSPKRRHDDQPIVEVDEEAVEVK